MIYVPVMPGMCCDLSLCSIEDAARLLGPAWIYTLHVHPDHVLHARSLLKGWGAITVDHPMSPYVNLVEEPAYERGEWCLQLGDRAYGSAPVSWP